MGCSRCGPVIECEEATVLLGPGPVGSFPCGLTGEEGSC